MWISNYSIQDETCNMPLVSICSYSVKLNPYTHATYKSMDFSSYFFFFTAFESDKMVSITCVLMSIARLNDDGLVIDTVAYISLMKMMMWMMMMMMVIKMMMKMMVNISISFRVWAMCCGDSVFFSFWTQFLICCYFVLVATQHHIC